MHFYSDSLEGLADTGYAELALSPHKSASLLACGIDNAKKIKKDLLTGKITKQINLSQCTEDIFNVDEFKFSLKVIKTKGVYHANFWSYSDDETIIKDKRYEEAFLNMYEGDDFRLIAIYNQFAYDPYAHLTFMSREGEIIVDANSEKKEFFSFRSKMDPSIEKMGVIGKTETTTRTSREEWSEDIVEILKLDNISIKRYISVWTNDNGEKHFHLDGDYREIV